MALDIKIHERLVWCQEKSIESKPVGEERRSGERGTGPPMVGRRDGARMGTRTTTQAGS